MFWIRVKDAAVGLLPRDTSQIEIGQDLREEVYNGKKAKHWIDSPICSRQQAISTKDWIQSNPMVFKLSIDVML